MIWEKSLQSLKIDKTFAIIWQTSLFHKGVYWGLERFWDLCKAPTGGWGRTRTSSGVRTEGSRFSLQNFLRSLLLLPHNENAAREVPTLIPPGFQCSLQHFDGWKTISFSAPPGFQEKMLRFSPSYSILGDSQGREQDSLRGLRVLFRETTFLLECVLILASLFISAFPVSTSCRIFLISIVRTLLASCQN